MWKDGKSETKSHGLILSKHSHRRHRAGIFKGKCKDTQQCDLTKLDIHNPPLKKRQHWSGECDWSQRSTQSGLGLRLRRVMCSGETVRKETRGMRRGSLEPWVNYPFPLPFPRFSLSAELMTHCRTEREPRGKDCESSRSTAAALL